MQLFTFIHVFWKGIQTVLIEVVSECTKYIPKKKTNNKMKDKEVSFT